ncbi:HAMP domain-containing protein [Candidatus Poribacteria bacterium]|nr:HAMP domain-containing protein [Candidatus Poribacteria bacterium]
MFTKFKHKIACFFSALTIIILAAVLLVVNTFYQSQAREQIRNNLKQTKLSFEQILSQRNRQLATNARLLSLDFALKQAIATVDDHETLLSVARNYRNRIESDLFIITDRNGKVLADTSGWKRFGDNLSNKSWIQEALSGEENLSLSFVDDRLYQVISLPLLAPDTIGCLSIGFRIDDSMARQLRRITQTEINFIIGNRVVASTLDADVRQALEHQLAKPNFRQSAISGDLFPLNLATASKEETFLSILGPISLHISDSEDVSISAPTKKFDDRLQEANLNPAANISSQRMQAGQGILMKKCVLCHNTQRILQNLERTPVEWNQIVRDMIETAVESDLLFRMDVAFQSQLENAHGISEDLRNEFENNQISLSQNATISTEIEDAIWQITDQNNRMYPIRKEADTLSVYSPTIEDFITQEEAELVIAYLVSIAPEVQNVADTERILNAFVGEDNEAEASDSSEMLRAFSDGESNLQAIDETDATEESDILSAFDDASELLAAFDEGEDELGVLDAEETVNASPSYLIQGSWDEALKPLKQIQRNLLFFAIGAIAISIGFSFVIATGVTSAVLQLVKGTEAVVAGNYKYSLNIAQRDEIGQLANHFNAMVAGLRDKERIRALMDKVVSKEIAEELLKGEVKLGGETRPCTMLFSDVRGWTTISEKLNPEALVEMLNSYLTLMSEAIENHKGVIDKYIGDAIVALFGAPISHQDDIRRSVDAALEMRRRLAILNAEREKNGEFPLEVGIGLNSGLVLAGNIGSEARLNYTVMGDNVNLAARLEGLTKLYGAGIIATDVIYKELGSDYLCRELDLIQVKGKTKSVRIFEVLESGKSEKLLQMVEGFESGLAYYRQQDWGRAEEAFTQTLGGFQNNLASELYLERIRLYRKSPPSSDWDGVFVATEKYGDDE